MMEISLSFMAWLTVLVIQVLVHIKVVYLRKRHYDDEPPMIEAEGERATKPEVIDDTTDTIIKESLRSYSSGNPAFDGDEFDDDEDDDDEPPNLHQRLSQTGSEMMSSCKSLETMVHEQILAQ